MGTAEKLIFLALIGLAVALGSRGVFKRYAVLRLGRPEARFGQPGRRLWSCLVYVLGQKKVLTEPYPGLMHLFIFWGFLVIVPGEVRFWGERLRPGFTLPLLSTSSSFNTLQDLFAVLVMAGLAMAAYRRYIQRPEGLERNLESAVILGLIGIVVVTLVLGNACQAALFPGLKESFLTAPLTGLIAAQGWEPGQIANIYYSFWWAHVLTILGFLVYLPYSKHLHLLAAPFNVYFRDLEPFGAMIKPVDFTADGVTLGAGRLTDFSWKQLLDLYACTKCGRCQDNCPAYLSGKPLSPKDFIGKMRNLLFERTGAGAKNQRGASGADAGNDLAVPLMGGLLDASEIWACTTCGACQYLCPVLVEHLPKRLDVRRFQVMEEAVYPEGLMDAVRCLEARGHPYRGTTSARSDWFKGVESAETGGEGPFEVLFWVGCTTALDERNTRIARSVAELLHRAGVSFAVLGAQETCCGDPARRIGNEYLYQSIVTGNISLLHKYGVKEIVTSCPHCYNNLKNEYPRFGGHFLVYHHSQYLYRLLKEGRLHPTRSIADCVTYHDPCYLGRYNGNYQYPRQIISLFPGAKLVEMDRHGKKSFCCGGGGGGAWLEEEGNRINRLRAAQAAATGAATICTACPFCLTMLEDGVKALAGEGQPMLVRDLAELLLERVGEQAGVKYVFIL